jgi:hypothetical protein
LLAGEVKIFGMNWSNVAVMIVDTRVMEMVATMVGARTIGVTLIGEMVPS